MSKEVYKKMAEISNRKSVELKSEVVEFALVDDLGKALTNAKSIIDEINSDGGMAEKSLKEVNALEKELDKSKKIFFKHQKNLEKGINKADKAEDKISGLFDKVDSAAKALGISPKDIGAYSELLNVSKEFQKVFSKYTSLTMYSDK